MAERLAVDHLLLHVPLEDRVAIALAENGLAIHDLRFAGARLHARIVALFSLIAALPALLLAIAATTTFSRALDNWFNQQTM